MNFLSLGGQSNLTVGVLGNTSLSGQAFTNSLFKYDTHFNEDSAAQTELGFIRDKNQFVQVDWQKDVFETEDDLSVSSRHDSQFWMDVSSSSMGKNNPLLTSNFLSETKYHSIDRMSEFDSVAFSEEGFNEITDHTDDDYSLLESKLYERVIEFSKIPHPHHPQNHMPFMWDLGKLLVAQLNESNGVDKNLMLKRASSLLKGMAADMAHLKHEEIFSESDLALAFRFVLCFQDKEYVERVSQLITWKHLKVVLELNDPMARDFYIEMAYRRNWNDESILEKEIKSFLFERSVLARQPDEKLAEIIHNFKTAELDQLNRLIDLKDLYLFPYVSKSQITKHELQVESLIVEKSSKFRRAMGIGFTSGEKQFYLNVMTEDGQTTKDKKVDVFVRWRKRPVLLELKVKVDDVMQHLGQLEGYRMLYQEIHPEDLDPLGILLIPNADQVYYHRLINRGFNDSTFVALYSLGAVDEAYVRKICARSFYLSEQRADRDRQRLSLWEDGTEGGSKGGSD